jgi:(+)-trans-carveol dehydrogenase
MTSQLTDRVALITGAARGQGRNHAVRLARLGADIIGVDLCADMPTAPYAGPTPAALLETQTLVEAEGRRMVAVESDVRDQPSIDDAVAKGVAEFGRIDTVVANAGILSFAAAHEITEEQWAQMLDVNLSGVWRTCKAAIPHMKEAGRGGSIVIVSSSAALRGTQNLAHYSAAKSGLVGLMRALSMELAADRIRVNSIHPTAVDTDMIHHEALYRLSLPDVDEPNRYDYAHQSAAGHPMGVPWVDSDDISDAVVWLASDGSRFVTGVQLPVMAGRDS